MNRARRDPRAVERGDLRDLLLGAAPGRREGARVRRGLFALLGYLVRRPPWLVGQFLATCAFALHASALHAGPIAVVQPIVVSGIVWAVPARAAISRQLPSLTELRAVMITAVGLAVFLVASDPTAGRRASLGTGTSLLGVAGVLSRSRRTSRPAGSTTTRGARRSSSAWWAACSSGWSPGC